MAKKITPADNAANIPNANKGTRELTVLNDSMIRTKATAVSN